MILEFTTEAAANACLAQINALAAAYWPEQGYTVVDGALVGKKNGADNPSAARTTTWDSVKKSPDGTFYIASLTGTPYEAAMDDLQAAFSFTEKDAPRTWRSDDV